MLRDARTHRMGTGRLYTFNVSRKRSEIPDRLGPLYGIPVFSRAVRKQQHVQAIFFDEETTLAERFHRGTGRRTSVGGRIQRLSATPMGEPLEGQRMVNREKGVYRTLSVRLPRPEG